jgi:hypothetical protein
MTIRPSIELVFASMARAFPHSEADLRAAVAASASYAEVLRRLGIRAAGGNHATVRKYVALWDIPTGHFDPALARRRAGSGRAVALEEVLVEHSTYSRGHLKQRLLSAGLLERRCSMCGQGERWHGRPISLVLDHINGVHDDHRLENLRLLCPNCNATLDTHCGRHNKRKHHDRRCVVCDAMFRPSRGGQLYCSRSCAGRGEGNRRSHVALRRVERPPYEQLVREIETMGYLAVGRKYGVSDNAIRKWRRAHEAAASAAGAPAGEPAGTPVPPACV